MDQTTAINLPSACGFAQSRRLRMASSTSADAVLLCTLLIRLGHGGDQFAARAKHLKRTYLRFAADEIKHRVGILDLIFEALRVIVHHLVRTEAPSVIDIFGSRRRDAVQASVTSELNRVGSDVSCSSMDDDRLASFEPGLVEQTLLVPGITAG
jgi:hypothetical protein